MKNSTQNITMSYNNVNIITYEGYLISLAILILGHCESRYCHLHYNVLHTRNKRHKPWAPAGIFPEGGGKTARTGKKWTIQCFMLGKLDIGLADNSITSDHKLISFDQRHVNENFLKIVFREKALRDKSKTLHKNCKDNIIMLICVSCPVNQFFA